MSECPPKDRLKEIEFQEILIIKPSSFGDVIHALPAVGAIRRRFKKARISWLIKSEWGPIIEGHSFIDEVLSVPFSWGSLQGMVHAVRKRSFDLVVDLQGLFRSAVLGFLSKAPVRIGLANSREGAPFFYTDCVSVPQGAMHAVDRYRLVSEALGAGGDRIDFGIDPSEEAVSSADQLMAEVGLPQSAPFVLVHPTARWESKKWDRDRFAKLGDWLIGEKNIPLFFVGSSGERSEIDQIISSMRQSAENLAGKTCLGTLAELSRRACFFVCNDSGPMHLAAAMGTPIFALFGPTDPKKVGPYGSTSTVIRKGVDCTGCRRGRCMQEKKCMKAILVEDVIREISSRWQEIKEPLNKS
ncbi:MAG: glycosyltransferase family 9 protein [Nitrospiria bacterium]